MYNSEDCNKVLSGFIFLFFVLVFTAPFTAGACVAFACRVAFRCSNSLFWGGNAQLQVTQ